MLRLSILLTGIWVLGLGCTPTYPTVDESGIEIVLQEGPLLKGKELTKMICGPCHYDAETEKLSGKQLRDIPGIIGKIYSANITQDTLNGIGKYREEELIWMMRTGITPKGHLSHYMAIPSLADNDLQAIVRFLKSSDPLVSASGISTKSSKYNFLAKAFMNVKLRSFPYPDMPIERPPVSDTIRHGKYLVATMGCYECHSGGFIGTNKMNPEKSKGYMAGGTRLKDAMGRNIFSPNLTPHDETGIGKWTQKEFVAALKNGQKPDGNTIQYPMPVYPELSNAEATAIYAYLKQLPPSPKRIRKRAFKIIDSSFSATSNTIGKELFTKYGCVGCHGNNGKGPVADITQAPAKYSHQEIMNYIQNAQQINPESRMPNFNKVISESDVSILAEYVSSLDSSFSTK